MSETPTDIADLIMASLEDNPLVFTEQDYWDSKVFGLAIGAIKIDGPPVINKGITGKERISQTDGKTGLLALEMHDKFIAEGEVIPDASRIRDHILRIVEESSAEMCSFM
ncbi:hypothetical protein KJ632_00175 [Patescibacteria group bacterium]|nr:hypothetical protein [Patescibacteria group bacterium]